MTEDINVLLLKLLVVILATPLWLPFAKAIWEEFNEALADEGGLFGRAPTGKEQAEIEERRLDREDPLVHEPWPSAEERMAGRRQMGGKSSEGSQGASKRGTERRAGFR